MAWGKRGRDLPANWSALVKDCKEAAGGRCEKIMPSGRRCPRPGSEADHYGDKDDHTKLRWLCTDHHLERTLAQAYAARVRKPTPKKRPHPGRLR